MHRYDELEKLYYKNKIKKYLIIFFLFILVLLFFFYLYKLSNYEKKTPNNTSLKIKEQKTANKNSDINTSVKVHHEVKNPLKKEKVKENNLSKNKNNKIIKKEKSTSVPNFSFALPNIKYVPQKQKQQNKPSKTKTVGRQTQKMKTFPVIKEENLNIVDVIQAFNKNPKYDTAILISKYFFNKKDYKNAKLWALKANNIDPSKPESWKIIAFILLKKNDKIKAREILKIYLNDYGDNEEINKLLRSIDE